MGRTAVTDRPPLLSGFCGYGGAHASCKGTQPDRGLRCDCRCHQVCDACGQPLPVQS